MSYHDDSPSDEDVSHPAKKAKGGTTPGRSRFAMDAIDVGTLLCFYACLFLFSLPADTER